MSLVYPLSAAIPIRDTSVWAGYVDIQTIPHAFGTVTLQPVQYDQAGYVFVITDHPLTNVLSVKRGGGNISSYDWYNGVDSTGQAVAFLELFASASATDIEVTVQGKIHPVTTGAMVRNGADVMWNIIDIPRDDVQESDFDLFRRDCHEFHLDLDGVIKDNTRTTNNILDEIAVSCGAVYSPGISSFARVFPRAAMPDNEFLAASFYNDTITDVKVNSRRSDIYTVLRVHYNFNHATGEPGGVMQIEAPLKIKRFGRITKKVELRWIKPKWLASQIGQRYLEYYARPKWDVVFKSIRYQISPGQYVNFQHNYLPSALWGYQMILSNAYNLLRKGGQYKLTFPVGDTPDVEITQDSEQFTVEES